MKPSLNRNPSERKLINDHYKFLTVGHMRELEKMLSKEEITYSRMIELINEMAFDYYDGNFPLRLKP